MMDVLAGLGSGLSVWANVNSNRSLSVEFFGIIVGGHAEV